MAARRSSTTATGPDSPYVLLTGGDDLGDITSYAKPLGSLPEVVTSAIVGNRELAVEAAKKELGLTKTVSAARLVEALDIAGLIFLRRFNAVVGPAMAAAYLDAFRAAGAGDVPVSTVYAMAERHTDRLGQYFNETSKEAMLHGFSAYVNRQLPARVAAERALDAWGLTPRQISGYTSLKPPKADTVTPLNLKRQVSRYVGTSIRRRAKIFAEQEAHNVDLQAKQAAWLWMQEKGRLGQDAEKVWLTAKDERTCAICAPMHGKRAKVGEKFTLPNGFEVWVAGVHPNCRCEVKVTDLSVVRSTIQKDQWFNDEYVRNSRGRFATRREKIQDLGKPIKYSAKTRTRVREDDSGFQNFLDELEPEKESLTFGGEDAPQSLSFGTAPLRFGQSAPTFGTREPLSFGEPEKKDDPVAFGSDRKRRLHPEKTQLSIGEREQLTFAVQDFMSVPLPAAVQTRRRDTINLLDYGGPAYAVIEDEEMFDHDGRIALDDSVVFYTNEDDVTTRAQQALESKRQLLYDAISHEDRDVLDTYRDNDDVLHERRLSYEAIKAAMEYVAHQDLAKEPGPSTLVPVDVWDEDGYLVGTDEVTVEEAADHLGITPEDVKVRVVALTQGYADEAQGMTSQLHSGGDNTYETWMTTGTYEVMQTGREVYPGNQFIERYDLIPEVEDEIVHTDIPMRFLDD